MADQQAAPIMMTPQQQMIVDSFNSEVYVKNRMDIQNTPLYDTVSLAASASITVNATAFFTNVGAQSNKSIGLTNMQQSQKLPAPEAFSILGFRFRFAENILLADILTLYNTQVFEFYLGQKYYQRAPLWFYGAAGGVSGFSNVSSTSVYTNGWPSRDSMHKLAITVVIENQMSFYGQLNGTAGQTLTATGSGGTGAYMVVLLDGLYARGVQ